MYYLDGGLPAIQRRPPRLRILGLLSVRELALTVEASSHPPSGLGLSQRADPVFSSRQKCHTRYLCLHLQASDFTFSVMSRILGYGQMVLNSSKFDSTSRLVLMPAPVRGHRTFSSFAEPCSSCFSLPTKTQLPCPKKPMRFS